MEKISLQYLDEILFIVTNFSPKDQAYYTMSSSQIKLQLNAKYSIDISTVKLNLLLEKLFKDGNLAMYNHNSAEYSLTYKGAFFRGYIKENKQN